MFSTKEKPTIAEISKWKVDSYKLYREGTGNMDSNGGGNLGDEDTEGKKDGIPFEVE